MRRFIIAIVLFIILISSISTALYFSDIVTDYILDNIDIEIENVGNGLETNGEHLLIAMEKWDDWKLIFFSIAPHDKIDSINTEFNICTAWSKTKEKDEYFTSLWSLKSALQIIRNLDRPSISRIF